VTKADVAELVTMLMAAFPHAKVSSATSGVYEMALVDLDKALGRKAVATLIATNRFLPTVAEIRETCVTLQHGRSRPGADAWGEVLAALKRYGYTRTPGVDFQFNDPLVLRAVRSLGWRELCGSDNSVADRARFIELYDSYRNNVRTDAQTLPGATSLDLPRGDGPRQLSELVGIRMLRGPDEE
jgi:hypothetical protein